MFLSFDLHDVTRLELTEPYQLETGTWTRTIRLGPEAVIHLYAETREALEPPAVLPDYPQVLGLVSV